MDGMQVAKTIRQISTTVPLIMLTARHTTRHQVLGLELGAQHYVTKPFSPINLIARIKAYTRRAEVGATAGATQATPTTKADGLHVTTDHFKLSTKTRTAYLLGKQITGLTPKTLHLYTTLSKSPKQVFSRTQLLQLVWDYTYYGDTHSVHATIKKLRQKITKVGPQILQTVWGVGYKLQHSGLHQY